MARLRLALSSGETATDNEVMRALRIGSSSFAPTPLGVDALPDKGVDTPPDKGFRTLPGKDSAGAIRVARLLLAPSLDVTATDDEAMRAFSTGSSSYAIPNVSSATGPTKKMACSARGVNGHGRVPHPSVAAVETGPNGRAPFSSTRALKGLLAGWTSLVKNEIESFSSESSRTGRSHELQTLETLGGRTWAKWALPLGLFAGLVWQSASLWVVVL